jgi:hypothetical protein
LSAARAATPQLAINIIASNFFISNLHGFHASSACCQTSSFKLPPLLRCRLSSGGNPNPEQNVEVLAVQRDAVDSLSRAINWIESFFALGSG